MRPLMNKISKAVRMLKIFCQEIFQNCLVVKMSAYFDDYGNIIKENWGDDINYWFLQEISNAKIISYDWSLRTRLFHQPYVMGIGSILTMFNIDNSIVWGSGVISSSAPIIRRPKEIRAVRGPLTRKRLLDSGIDCPEVYGDPALLLPRYYKPGVKEKYRLGIIPHYKDFNNPVFDKFKNDPNIIIIKTRNYDNWLDFIDQICQCQAVASSSLHGLIVSEAYGIPNLWIKLERVDNSDDVKYHDFFLSVGVDRNPYIFEDLTSEKDIKDALQTYKKGYINLEPLISACPIKLKRGILQPSC